MGWWHFGVMDGDTPQDIATFLKAKLIGVCRSSTPRGVEAYASKFNATLTDRANIENLIASLPECADRMALEDDEMPYFWQVLGVLCMEAGGRIDIFKAQLLAAIDNDPFATRSGQRKAAMDVFKVQVLAYKGAMIKVKHTGMFEAFDEHTGGRLINK